MAESLKDFLAARKKQTDAQRPELLSRLKTWAGAVDALFEQIKRWTAEAERAGFLKVERDEIELKEEGVEPYRLPRIFLRTDDAKITFEPKGMRIVGADGRIDIDGRGSLRHLFLRNGSWYLEVERPAPKWEPLDERLFDEVLREILS